jgi:uncharacterized protein (DUF433 family)
MIMELIISKCYIQKIEKQMKGRGMVNGMQVKVLMILMEMGDGMIM